MKRIVRLNAVENIWPEGILGMDRYSLHPNEALSPQKLMICGVSFASPIFAFLNTLNRNNRYSLFKPKTSRRNIGFNNLLLRGSLNKLREVQYFFVLSVNITFVMIFAMRGRIREIKLFTKLFREAQLYLAAFRNRINSEVLDVVTPTKDKTAVLPINLTYRLLTFSNQENKLQTLLTFLSYKDCEFMCEKVVYTHEETKTATELAEGYQVKLLWEGKK
jgi:hypothetical protein